MSSWLKTYTLQTLETMIKWCFTHSTVFNCFFWFLPSISELLDESARNILFHLLKIFDAFYNYLPVFIMMPIYGYIHPPKIPDICPCVAETSVIYFEFPAVPNLVSI